MHQPPTMSHGLPSRERAQPLVCLVVLNWNGYADTHECLCSLGKLTYPHRHIIVVDNASSDDSPVKLQAQHPEIELVRCSENLGIAAGYNRGIQKALAHGADYIVVMNNDLIVDPQVVDRMIEAQQAWPNCGIVMPKILYYDARDTIWSAGAYARWMPSNIVMRGKNRKDGPAYAETKPIEYAPSCCLLLTRELCQRLMFDEQYFFYYDDWDFCLQARKLGQRIVFAAHAYVWHKVSRSTLNSPKSQRWWEVLGRSCARYHRKHHSLGLLATYVSWVALRETIKGNLRSIPTFLRGVWTGLHLQTAAEARMGWRD
ncbi:glycosyltransferase family 2 protein [Kallotenue papyrolyticum]|uniref:glycosyltransferase family 2 protein n=1 Tax=Kallotenue papyrolyticum TaxID=1325125 RepID=UPI0009DDDC95|nr:glycosyltransferase family 2 protein [Kallotenue papyrolyticum]